MKQEDLLSSAGEMLCGRPKAQIAVLNISRALFQHSSLSYIKASGLYPRGWKGEEPNMDCLFYC